MNNGRVGRTPEDGTGTRPSPYLHRRPGTGRVPPARLSGYLCVDAGRHTRGLGHTYTHKSKLGTVK